MAAGAVLCAFGRWLRRWSLLSNVSLSPTLMNDAFGTECPRGIASRSYQEIEATPMFRLSSNQERTSVRRRKLLMDGFAGPSFVLFLWFLMPLQHWSCRPQQLTGASLSNIRALASALIQSHIRR